ncbi:MAG: DAK2 domain-containing protein [Anaerolineales bacterium]
MNPESAQTRTKRKVILQQYPIDGQAVKRLAAAGLKWLDANRQVVNSLNVFPVPDGDTGTNMVLTMKAAYDEIKDSPEPTAGKMLEALAQGALLGARGNSGVILSQIWRGFARSVDGKQVMDSEDLAQAFAAARDTAYKGVVRPVEGTILTVIKDMAAEAGESLKDGADPATMLQRVLKAADESVQHTPELLPILKEAGVVDSGGKGLFFLLEGMMRWVEGQQLEQAETSAQPLAALNLDSSMESVEEGQDYEVVVDFRPYTELDLQKFYGNLEKMGTSIQVGEGDGMYRMHIHVPTEKRYEPIDYTMQLGTVTNVAIENLMAQMDEISQKAHETKIKPVKAGEIAVVAVAPGPGIARHFAELGVAAIVEGGQTMNPSTADILASFENLPTDKVVILPNNKNIVMAANSAIELSVKKVVVVPSVNVPQGIAAMLKLSPSGELNAVAEEMKKAMGDVQAGEVTTATRNVEIEGVNVKEGDVIGLHNGKLVVADKDLETATLNLLDMMKFNDFEILTIYTGQDLADDKANAITEAIRKAYPKQEVEVHQGRQPHYYFIFAVE